MARQAPHRSQPPLDAYAAKRNFSLTPEPAAARARSGVGAGLRYVVQEHHARRLHYDFRLELDGVLLSWAVPKAPSGEPGVRRLAVQVENHPVAYGSFEGTIPPGQYGAGTVSIWDHGRWTPEGDPRAGLAAGKLAFTLHGERLSGAWELIRLKDDAARQPQWLLFKRRERAQVSGTQRAAPERADPGREPVPDAEAAGTFDPTPGVPIDTLPATLAPQLATLVDAVPQDGEWIHEIKFDGYRVLARIEAGDVRLLTRAGNDWTSKMPPIAAELRKLALDSAWLDGEVVVLRDGAPDFNALQNAFDERRAGELVYFVFDLPFLDGRDLRDCPLQARRERLARLLDRSRDVGAALRFSEAFPFAASDLVASACELGLEGVIAKRADARYRGGRTRSWLKIKCGLRQEFVIVGFTDRRDDPHAIGSLLLGYHDADGVLRDGGKVGTGWTVSQARALRGRLAALEEDARAGGKRGKGTRAARTRAADRPRRAAAADAGTVHRIAPTLVAEVAFSEWTPDGLVRQASFIGLRDDKPARQIVRETPLVPLRPDARARGGARTNGAPPAIATPAIATPVIARLTHGDRVIDPQSGLRKRDLAEYYASVADRLLPHLADRPVSVLRAPQGIGGKTFFQKHPAPAIPGVRTLDASLWPGHAALMTIDDHATLMSAAQMNVVELHTWNSTAGRIDLPDRMVFDLDPGEGTAWTRVQEAALLVRTLLEEIGLPAFLKTSGGKGLHVVVPLRPRESFDTVKDFARALVLHLAATFPDRFVAKSGAANRIGRIFVDYLRNGLGATTATAFSARARPGLGVSVPIGWDRLPAIESGDQWTVARPPDPDAADAWSHYERSRRPLGPAMRAFAGDAARATRPTTRVDTRTGDGSPRPRPSGTR